MNTLTLAKREDSELIFAGKLIPFCWNMMSKSGILLLAFADDNDGTLFVGLGWAERVV